VLALQRTIGNAAVARLIEEDRRTHDGIPGPESSPRTALDEALRSSGSPLDPGLRERMETAMGADFSSVVVHSGPVAQRSATALGARAFTTGNHIVLGEGGATDHTMAHELTHVLQQRTGPVAGTDASGVRVSDPGDPFEREAETTARRLTGGSEVQRTAGGSGRLATEAAGQVWIQRFAHAVGVQTGAPNTPYFIAATREAVFEQARSTVGGAHPDAREIATKSGMQWQYRCVNCVHVYGDDFAWHFRINVDIDHRDPFAELVSDGQSGKRPAYPGFPSPGNLVNWWGPADLQAIYNDLDNLHVSCAGHNRTKGNDPSYDTRNRMAIAAVLNPHGGSSMALPARRG
jgi:hypothetical protein